MDQTYTSIRFIHFIFLNIKKYIYNTFFFVIVCILPYILNYVMQSNIIYFFCIVLSAIIDLLLLYMAFYAKSTFFSRLALYPTWYLLYMYITDSGMGANQVTITFSIIKFIINCLSKEFTQ